MATGHQLRCAEPCSCVLGLGVMFALDPALLTEISPLLTRLDRGGWQWTAAVLSTTAFARIKRGGSVERSGRCCCSGVQDPAHRRS